MASMSSSSNKKSFHYLLQRNISNPKCQNYPSISQIPNPSSSSSNKTLIFDVENTLLKSPSLFPYFMLVAFEAGSLIRALILLLLYPFLGFFGSEISLKIMVMVCFFGIKKSSFNAGRAILPKFFLEDVGFEIFQVLRGGGRRVVGVSCLPQVMVESFLKDYLEVEFVVGRELKEIWGYFVGIMEDKGSNIDDVLGEIMKGGKNIGGDCEIIGICGFNKSIAHPLFSSCKDTYLVNEEERRSWNRLPRKMYPKPLIFHDGRLAFRPTPLATLAMFLWLPFGILLAICRTIVVSFFPFSLTGPFLTFTGMDINFINVPAGKPKRGIIYVCNHRCVLDAPMVAIALKKPLSSPSYSISRFTELISPIKTLPLTRDREKDAKTIEAMLKEGDVVVCAEGTTCREPYLLRFSPLFAEISDEIMPVAITVNVSMFYGTTASGLKWLDNYFLMMNPRPGYTVRFLGKVAGISPGKSKFEVANDVQREIGKALGFECTMLTRKDKYLLLAGNEGRVCTPTKTTN